MHIVIKFKEIKREERGLDYIVSEQGSLAGSWKRGGNTWFGISVWYFCKFIRIRWLLFVSNAFYKTLKKDAHLIISEIQNNGNNQN